MQLLDFQLDHPPFPEVAPVASRALGQEGTMGTCQETL